MQASFMRLTIICNKTARRMNFKDVEIITDERVYVNWYICRHK